MFFNINFNLVHELEGPFFVPKYMGAENSDGVSILLFLAVNTSGEA